MGEKYKLERIVDLLQIPSERREALMHDLLLALEFAELSGDELIGPIEWTDDGDQSCELLDETGKPYLRLEVRK